METPATLEEAAPLLRPRAMGAVPMASMDRRIAQASAEHGVDPGSGRYLSAPLVADISLGVYLSYPETNVPITNGQVQEWGTTPQQVLGTALETARRLDHRAEGIDGCMVVQAEGVPGLLLASPSIIIKGLTDGRPAVVLAPTPESLIVAPRDDRAALETAADLALQLLQQEPRGALSPTALTTDGADWSVFTYPTDSFTYGQMARYWWMLQYSQAKPQLEELVEETETADTMVSDFKVGEHQETGRYQTFATVVADHPTLVPSSCDEVVLIAADGSAETRAFAELASSTDLLQPVPDFVPPYHRIQMPA